MQDKPQPEQAAPVDHARRALTLLAQSGNTPDEVATSLKARAMQGVRHTVRFLNPVVRYLQTELAGTRDMDVINADRLSITLLDGSKEDVSLPTAIREFLDAFNQRAYPDLELPVG
jgi:hypothetical protein